MKIGLITAAGTILTAPLCGLGGLALFRLILNRCFKPINSNENSTTQRSNQTFQKTINQVNVAPIDKTKQSFPAFIQTFENEILPFYEQHEKSFDKYSIHGRMHASRAVIFGEVMARYMQKKGANVNFFNVRAVIGMHDSGRKGNGIDLWETESADLLFDYLKSKSIPETEAHETSRLIIKDQKNENLPVEYVIFQSADCIDIMRPCTGHGGRTGFKEQYLTFFKDAPADGEDFKFRQDLIEEAWKFIELTEAKKQETQFQENKGFMTNLLKIIENNQMEFKILSTINS